MPAAFRYASLAVSALALVACGKQTAPTTPPEPVIAQAPEPEPEPEEVEPEAPTRRVGDDAVAVGTFNLQWAHDALGDDGPKLSKQFRAQTEADWEWKVEQIAKLLVAEKLDVVALQELGGNGEVTDIVMKVVELGGPNYDWAFVESTDRTAGHHVAILSVFPISNQRRLDIHMRRHLAADIDLPNDHVVTFIAFHAAGGKYAGNEKTRTKQAKALKRKVNALQKENPVIVLGTANSPYLPDAKEYKGSSVGMLAGAVTRQDSDDCLDSANFISGQATNVHGETTDRILTCGLEITDVEMSGHEAIIRNELDPTDQVWSAVPTEAAPFRDVSDHLVLWAEIAVPKPPAPEAEGGGDTSTASP